MRLRRAEPAVYSITGARRSLTEDVGHREKWYVITMGIRTVCFIAAVLVHGPLRYVLLVAAVVLPYFAVVFANGGRERAIEPPTLHREAAGRPLALEPGKDAKLS